MGIQCFYCPRRDVTSLQSKEIVKGNCKIVFQVGLCPDCYKEWLEKKVKEGFK